MMCKPFRQRRERPAASTPPAGGYSLRKRLIVAILGASSLIWVVSLVLIVSVAWRETSDVFDDALKEGARLALVLGANMQSRGMLASPLQRDADEPTKLKIYYQIVADDGQVLQRSRHAPIKPFSDQLKASKTYQNVWIDRELWRVYVLRADGLNFQVQIGQEWDERTAVLGNMAQKLAWPALMLLALLAAFCWWSIRKLLAPIEFTAQRIASKSAQDLSPVPVENEPRELQPIMTAFNDVLARLDRAIEGERRFTADAAHELRTPLAALGMRLQLMQRQQKADPLTAPQSLQALRNEVDRCTALIESLLMLARLDPQLPDALTKEAVDLPAEFATLAASLPPEERPRVNFSCQVASLQAQPVLFRSALRNLLDNALRYSGETGQVRIEAQPMAQGVRITVQDDGTGVSSEDRMRLTERFFRVLGSGKTGSGLGLSIVEKIALLHGATLTFGTGIDGQGLGVAMNFPNV